MVDREENVPIPPRAILEYVAFVLFKRKYSILFYGLFTFVAMVFCTYLITPQWLASAKLLIQENPSQQVIVFEGIEFPSRGESKSVSVDLVEMLLSQEFAGKVVTKFKLDERMREKVQNPPDFRQKFKLGVASVLTSPLLLAQKLGILPVEEKDFFADAVEEFVEDMVAIELVEGTSTIDLAIYAETPELAVGIANYMKDLVIERAKEYEQIEAEEAYEFLKSHMSTVKESLDAEEAALLAYMEDHGITDLGIQKEQLLSRLDQIEIDLAANQKLLAGTEAKLAEYERQLLPSGVASTVDEPLLSYARFRDSMDEAEVEKQLLNTRTAREELLAIQTKLLEEEVGLHEQVDTLASIDMGLQRISRSVEGHMNRFTTMRDKFLELEVQKFTQTPEYDVKVTAEPFIPRGWDPDWPDWVIFLAIIVTAALSISLGLAFFQEYWVDAIQTPRQLQAASDLPLVGQVPPLSGASIWKQLGKPRLQRTPAPAPRTEDAEVTRETS